MRIKVGSFILCDGLFQGPENLRINGRRTIELEQYVRASVAVPKQRLNSSVTVEFTTHRIHTDLMAAGKYMLDHEADLPRTGTVHLYALSNTGTETHYQLVAGLIESNGGEQIGLSTIHQYKLIGSNLARVTS